MCEINNFVIFKAEMSYFATQHKGKWYTMHVFVYKFSAASLNIFILARL